jgi:APA family basic amino acid/polyamine antiporter
MVNYKDLQVGDPLAYVFAKVGLKNISYVISISAVIATASVLLIFQLGQPRIWMSMSRDGLLPKAFSRIHPKFHTPSFATIVTGFVVAIPALFLNLTEVTNLNQYRYFICLCTGMRRCTFITTRSCCKRKVPPAVYQFAMDSASAIYSWLTFSGTTS